MQDALKEGITGQSEGVETVDQQPMRRLRNNHIPGVGVDVGIRE
jgi:hypothetical protein